MVRLFSPVAMAMSALLALAGCAASQTTSLGMPGVGGANRGHSWMSPNAKNVKRLLYVADGGVVHVYNYDNLQVVGTLTSLDTPTNGCVDAKGNVWIIEEAGGSQSSGYAVELARGGTELLRTLTTSGLPTACSVSPNGELAVINFGAPNYERGNVQVFGPASSTPQAYIGADDCFRLNGGGYDNKGNLFLAAASKAGYGQICQLRLGSSALTAAFVNQTIEAPEGIMWDGKYLAVTNDQQVFNAYKTVILQVQEGPNGSLTITGQTALAQTCFEHQVDIFPAPFIVGKKNTPVNDAQGSELIGRNYLCGLVPSIFGFWSYPAGGNPSRSLAVDSGDGAFVSIRE